MTRTLHVTVAVALVVIGAGSVGCGRPTPGEMPPLAPRPERIDPAGSPAGSPAPGVVDPRNANRDAGVELPPGPVATVRVIPAPEFRSARSAEAGHVAPTDAEPIVEPPTNVNAPTDAGVKDSYTPPLPPIPDAGLPDSRLEPH